MFQCRVVDMDPELEGRSRETVVKILTDYQPVPPGRAPFELVEFEGLTVTPYVNDKNPDGVLAARHRPQGRGPPGPGPGSVEGRGVTAPAAGARAGGAGRRPVRGDVPGVPEPVAAAGHHHRPVAAGHPDAARPPGGGARRVRPSAGVPGDGLRGGGRAAVPGPGPAASRRAGDGMTAITTSARSGCSADGAVRVEPFIRLTGNTHIRCRTYDDQAPILAIDDGNVSAVADRARRPTG